jgi:cytoskeleton protein RodZ
VPAPAKPDETPLVASMTPFPAAAAEKKPAAVSAPVSKPGNRLHLSLTQASWVEIVDAAGTKIEYGLLPAGSERDYDSDQALDIRIGNADGASLTIEGKALDLATFRRANVAHLKLVGGTASTVHGG